MVHLGAEQPTKRKRRLISVRNNTSVDYVVAGGGTGGHVYPALAIADALRGVEPGATIHFVGSRRGLEATAVPAAGYGITLCQGRGVARKVSLDSLWSIVQLIFGCVQGAVAVLRRRPRAVVSVGGYAALGAGFGAVLGRIPLVLAEANAVPGGVHRILGRFAAASAVSWPSTALPKAVLTGNPVREDVAKLREYRDVKKARKTRGIPQDRVMIAVVGGSLGAKTINDAAFELAEQWKSRADVALWHVVGKRNWDPKLGQPVEGALWLKRTDYENNMAELLEACDVVVARSGASTCAELALVGIPAVLVPLPHTPGDHQVANARALGEGVTVLDDATCTGEALAAALEPLVSDSSCRDEARAQVRAVGVPDAAANVASLVRASVRDIGSGAKE